MKNHCSECGKEIKKGLEFCSDCEKKKNYQKKYIITVIILSFVFLAVYNIRILYKVAIPELIPIGLIMISFCFSIYSIIRQRKDRVFVGLCMLIIAFTLFLLKLIL